jgi:ferredoxin
VQRGIACGSCPGRLQQGNEIHSSELSMEHGSDMKPTPDSIIASGIRVRCDVMNIQ